MDFFLFIGLLIVAYAAVVWVVKKMEKKPEVFMVPWDEIYDEFGCYDMPPEKLKKIIDEMLPRNKLEKAERDKLLKAVYEGRPVLKAVELTNRGVEFTFCHTEKTQEAQPAELAELRAKQLGIIEKHYARAKREEISYVDATELAAKAMDDSGIKVMSLDEDFIFCRFGAFFGLKAWRSPDTLEGYAKLKPAISRKITKVELTNDGVQFTTVRA